jgi:hypothetical protein
VVGGYFFKAYGVANFPIGFSYKFYRKCENKVEETLHGIFPFLMAAYFCSFTLSV